MASRAFTGSDAGARNKLVIHINFEKILERSKSFVPYAAITFLTLLFFSLMPAIIENYSTHQEAYSSRSSLAARRPWRRGGGGSGRGHQEHNRIFL